MRFAIKPLRSFLPIAIIFSIVAITEHTSSDQYFYQQ